MLALSEVGETSTEKERSNEQEHPNLQPLKSRWFLRSLKWIGSRFCAGLRYVTRPQGCVATVTALGTITAAGLLYKYTFYTAQQADAMRKQLEATDRPWIKVEPAMIDPIVFTDTGVQLGFRFTVTNVGHSVANRVSVVLWVIYHNEKEPDWEQASQVQGWTCDKALTLSEPAYGGGAALFPDQHLEEVFFGSNTNAEMEANLLPPKPPPWSGKYFEPAIVGCVVYWLPYSKEPHHTRFAWNVYRKTPSAPLARLPFKLGEDVQTCDIILRRIWLGCTSAD